jgi:aspartate aminotransferase-like enzyme
MAASEIDYLVSSSNKNIFTPPTHAILAFLQALIELEEEGGDCFRIGHIGRIEAGDVRALMAAIAETLQEMNICLVGVGD